MQAFIVTSPGLPLDKRDLLEKAILMLSQAQENAPQQQIVLHGMNVCTDSEGSAVVLALLDGLPGWEQHVADALEEGGLAFSRHYPGA